MTAPPQWTLSSSFLPGFCCKTPNWGQIWRRNTACELTQAFSDNGLRLCCHTWAGGRPLCPHSLCCDSALRCPFTALTPLRAALCTAIHCSTDGRADLCPAFAFVTLTEQGQVKERIFFYVVGEHRGPGFESPQSSGWWPGSAVLTSLAQFRQEVGSYLALRAAAETKQDANPQYRSPPCVHCWEGPHDWTWEHRFPMQESRLW